MKLIKEWIDYQKIAQHINLLESSHRDHPYMNRSESSDQADEFKVTNISSLALSKYKNYKPTHQQLIFIKEKWFYILENLTQADADERQLDIGDYEEFAEITDQIDLINDSIKKLAYESYLKDERAPRLCVDWIRYQ